MSWTEIKSAYAPLAKAASDGAPLAPHWDAFRTVVGKYESTPPYHLAALLKRLDDLRGDRDRSSIAILDQGCGGGLTLLFLAASGYTDIRGVDVHDSNCERWNALTRNCLGHPEDRFFVYDGRTLPFASQSIDLLISQEVLEHVHDDVLDTYYSEGARVLKPGGRALHSVPHRLVPYDSHTQTWFLHWFLPRRAWLRVLKALGRSNETAEHGLFLRWPGTHKSLLRRHFGTYRDVTSERLTGLTEMSYYDGNIGLRRRIGGLCRVPVVGAAFTAILSRLMMTDTVAQKTTDG
ncbi:methyltransferase domain-containing protein [Pacificispira sp.]|uniref:class I SAM-dependent methyltransferase n=1 Tax=Pacificispira sp. TaxID=2888761 RepID=UPI003BAD9A03